MYTFFS